MSNRDPNRPAIGMALILGPAIGLVFWVWIFSLTL